MPSFSAAPRSRRPSSSLRACRDQRTRAVALVLVSVQGRQRSERGGADAHGAGVGAIEDLRFAFVSCQHYAQGFYYAHKHLADEDLDFAVHLGDYIYEGRRPAPSAVRACPTSRSRRSTTIGFASRSTNPIRICSPFTRRSRGSSPGTIETENDYASFIPENVNDTADNQPDFASRRARATRCSTSTCRSARRSCRSARRCSCSAACSSARCCPFTSSTRGSIDRAARRRPAC